ncbi:ABC transporter ATP-binding protein [Arthrobacter sp. PAMC25564]|uniref:ABC transporter ATP-binding protein n=1 Tax=Arthrobacter sp. PAMC25564 TaxID=2565366 RepID=UPI0010A266F6|nr:ABC transporter ATP-binding protein [Arthrobacter sp. PAMC25564]QCB99018.1 ABC transporter ATP-binding protein [Arthrobacter sp. PAMC25564]
MLGVIAATCAFAALNVGAPKVLGDATDVVVAAVVGDFFDEEKLAALLLGVSVMYLGASVFSWIQGSLTATAVQRIGYGLRASVEEKLHVLPSSHFDEQHRGEVLSRATNDVDNISQALNQLLNQLIMSVLMLLGALAMMLLLSPLLALIALLSVPLSTLATVLVARSSQAHFTEQWSSTGELHSQLEEFFTGHEVIKAFGRQEASAASFRASNAKLTRASARAQYVSGAVQPLMVFVSNLNYIAVAVVGALQVTTGAMTIGGLQAFFQFSRLFSQPMGQIGGMLTLVQSCLASAERVFFFLDAPEIPPETPATAPGRRPVPKPSPAPVRNTARHSSREPSLTPGEDSAAATQPVVAGHVVFEHVTFSYGPGSPAVENLSFAVEPGQTVAIVGHTGAGKTTVVNLLMRFYELDSGRITVDGTDIAELPRDELRSRFGTVLQDAWLFTGTIRDNIEYGRPGASDAEIVAAARASHVDQFVRSLPAGYATMLGNDGDSLSRGQRQLISIARAELAGRSILVLDEATSSVDSRTEVQIRKAMKRLREGHTSFVIAHRLSTVRDADLILVMDHGRIVEHGTHQQLMARGGRYTALYEAQFAGREQTQGVTGPEQ